MSATRTCPHCGGKLPPVDAFWCCKCFGPLDEAVPPEVGTTGEEDADAPGMSASDHLASRRVQAPTVQRIRPKNQEKPDGPVESPTPPICFAGDPGIDAFIKEGRSIPGNFGASFSLLLGGLPIGAFAVGALDAAVEPMIVEWRFGLAGAALAGALMEFNVGPVYRQLRGEAGAYVVHGVAGLAVIAALLGSSPLGLLLILASLVAWLGMVIDVNVTITHLTAHYRNTARKRIADVQSTENPETDAVLEAAILQVVFGDNPRQMERMLARIHDRNDGHPALWNMVGATALMHGMHGRARHALQKAAHLGVAGELAELVQANLNAAGDTAQC